MRPDRRWWIFILAMAMAWGGWWWHGRRPPRPEGGRAPAVEERVPVVAEGPASAIPPEPDGLPTVPPAPPEPGPALVDADGPPSPPSELPAPAPSPSGGPAVANSSGFEGLPAIDDQIRPAATSVELSPDRAADLRRGEQAMKEGRLAEAERQFLAAIGQPGAGAIEARKKLAEVYWIEGRLDEVRVLSESIWREADRDGAHREAQAMLQFHLALGLNPLPIDRIRATLDRAIGQAPQDDRVWLARGYLALRQGRLTEARSWFDACLRRRADDPAVWRARLESAMAADRVAEAREALPHLHWQDEPPARLHELKAWFAARRGDADGERRALEQAVAADPSDVVALERLAELAARGGHAEVAARLHRRKAEVDERLHRYRTIFREDDALRSTMQMARLAEELGRRFEAVGLWSLVHLQAPGDPDAAAAIERLSRTEPVTSDPARIVAEFLAVEAVAAPVASRPEAARASKPSTRVVPLFRDEAQASGLRFTFQNGATPGHQLPEASSGGVGLLDYDGDGRLDVYLVQGGTFPPPSGPRPFGDRLFRNRGGGKFEDATRTAGLSGFAGGYGHGVAVGDYDNDGHPDLFVTRWRSYALYHNRGDGTFEDATERADLGGDRDWPTSSAFADLDGDGDLDLYVCHYLDWNTETPTLCRSPASGRVGTCDPLRFAALPDHLFRNDGGRFVNATKPAGIADRDGRGLGVIAADFDEDGRIDLFVANDSTANFLFLNRGGLTFAESGDASGVSAAGGGGYRAGMGVARGDYDGDGRPDLVVTNFFGESSTFYQNLGGGLFTDRTSAIGLAAPSRYRLGFGVAFLDADADGRLDLLTVNGHITDERPEIPYTMPAQLLLGGSDGRLADVSPAAGPPFQVPRLGRGLAVGDLDDDGRLDAIVVDHAGPVSFIHNAGPGGHSITLRLEGTTSNRDAVGARVTIEAGGRRQVADRFGGGSYQSAGDPRLHFGLGRATQLDALEVRWPSGRIDRYRGLPADEVYLIREGAAEPRAIGVKAHAVERGGAANPAASTDARPRG